MNQSKLRFNREIMDDAIRTIIDRETRKKPKKMDLDLIIDGLDYLHPFNEQEDELRTKVAWNDFQNRYIYYHSRIRTFKTIIVVSILMVMILVTTVCYALGIDVFSIAIQWTKEQLNMYVAPNGVVTTEELEE